MKSFEQYSSTQPTSMSSYRFMDYVHGKLREAEIPTIKSTIGDPSEPVYPPLIFTMVTELMRGVDFSKLPAGEESEKMKQVAGLLGIDTEHPPKSNSYTNFSGDPQLRKQFVEHFNARHKTSFSADDVLFTVGAMNAIFLTVLDSKDPIILHHPGFTVYQTMIKTLGKEGFIFDTTKDQYKVTTESLHQAITTAYEKAKEQNPSLKKEDFKFRFIFTDPGNPTGYKHSDDELKAIAKLFRNEWKSGQVVVDSIYLELTHDHSGGRPNSLLDVAPDLQSRMIFVDSASKADGAAGHRAGYIVCSDKGIIKSLSGTQIIMNTHPAISSQTLMAASMEHRDSYVRDNAEAYSAKVSLIHEKLSAEGVMSYKPNASFYTIADLSFMKDLPLSEKTIIFAIEFFGYEKAQTIFQANKAEDGKYVVGNNSMLACLELASKTGVVTAPIMSILETDHVTVCGQEQTQKPLVRIVPNLEEQVLKDMCTRIIELKKSIEKAPPNSTHETGSVQLRQNLCLARL